MKKAYSPPTLTLKGALEDLTQGQSTGSVLDATFSAGTPSTTPLTFS